jgi:lipoprotein NlpD
LRAVAALAVVLALGACATNKPAPIESRPTIPPPMPAPASPPVPPGAAGAPQADAQPQSYTVRRGDTLYQIALDHGLDYRDIAAWNGLENPNRILVGQALRLVAPGEAGAPVGPAGVTTAPLRTTPVIAEARPAAPASPAGAAPATAVAPPAAARTGDNVKSSPKALKEPYSVQAVRDLTLASTAPPAIATPPAAAPPPAGAPKPAVPESAEVDGLEWAWPARGTIVGGFSDTANLKGIDIAGKAGDPVLASAPGKVVYAGTGIRGYGKLVIVKHNDTYLSAYAHNREIVVKEGQQVAKGQKIAEMGNSDADQVKLHFEIRRRGKPMDPIRYLPPA